MFAHLINRLYIQLLRELAFQVPQATASQIVRALSAPCPQTLMLSPLEIRVGEEIIPIIPLRDQTLVEAALAALAGSTAHADLSNLTVRTRKGR
jgi:hypothetical protein